MGILLNHTRDTVFLPSEIPWFISVVIPAYNSAQYLQSMLDSIYCQTYSHFEIIVAYDIKSTDDTLEILKTNASVHNLIIDSGNDTSPGMARNRGARFASGSYILYLDADDLIIPTYFEDMIGVFKQHPELDVVHFGFIEADEKHAKKYLKKRVDKLNIILSSSIDILPAFFFNGFGMPWNWLVKRAFVLDNQITFRDYTWGEDTFYSFQLLINTKCVGVVDDFEYIWIQHKSSLTHSNKNSWVMRRENRLKAAKDMFDVISHRYPVIYPAFERNYRQFCNRELVYSVRKCDYHTFKLQMLMCNIKKLELLEFDSLMDKLNIICFNLAKPLYWIIHKILD